MLRHCHRQASFKVSSSAVWLRIEHRWLYFELLQHLRVAIGAGTCFSSKSTTRTWEFGQMIRWLGPSTTGLSLTGHYLKRGALNSDWGWMTWGLMGFSVWTWVSFLARGKMHRGRYFVPLPNKGIQGSVFSFYSFRNHNQADGIVVDTHDIHNTSGLALCRILFLLDARDFTLVMVILHWYFSPTSQGQWDGLVSLILHSKVEPMERSQLEIHRTTTWSRFVNPLISCARY